MNEDKKVIFADTCFYKHPTSEELKNIAISAARVASKFGWVPKVSLTSFATFGKPRGHNSKTVEGAVELLQESNVDFEFDGELSPEVALDKEKLSQYEFSRLKDPANVLIMPDKHAAGISIGLLRSLSSVDIIGDCIYGYNKSVQILDASMNADDIYRIAHICATHSLLNKMTKSRKFRHFN